MTIPSHPTDAPTPEAMETATKLEHELLTNRLFHSNIDLAHALDTFAAARVKEAVDAAYARYEEDHKQLVEVMCRDQKEAVEKEREEIEWLRRLLHWCRSRLKHESYQVWLDKYLALGPSPAPEDGPAVVQSGEAP